MSLFAAVASLILLHLNYCGCDNTAVAIKDSKISLPCRHTHSESDILKVFWQVNDERKAAVSYQPGDTFPLAVYNNRLVGRVDIDFPSGDLILDPVRWEDAGTYNCFITLNNGGSVSFQKYKLSVHVVPERVLVNCSAVKSSMPDRPCSEVQSPVRISCSATSSPKSRIEWPTKPEGCTEVESAYCSVGDSPSVCVSELEELCAGTYACQVIYDDNIVQRTIPGTKITVNGDPDAGTALGQHTEAWKIVLITILVLVLLTVVILVISILLAKRYCVNTSRHNGNPDSCVEKLYAPCFCCEKSSERPIKDNGHHSVHKTEQIPLHVNEPHRSVSDPDSSEEDNPSNSVTERKQVRPEILQAIEAAKSLADAPAASRVNFMVTTIGGTKYKFDIEKENKASNSRSGSMDNFDSAGVGSIGDTKTRSIKGPSDLNQRKPKIEVDEVD